MDAVERQLVSERDGLIRLLTPPFDRTPHDPGYIKGYVPGVRENGGQYTHARALGGAGAGRGWAGATAPRRLLEMLSPMSHARTPEQVGDLPGRALRRRRRRLRRAAARRARRLDLVHRLGRLDVPRGAGVPARLPDRGRNDARAAPRIPASWPECELCWRLPGGAETCNVVTLTNRPGGAGKVVGATLDGEAVLVREGAARVPIARDGGNHQVRLDLA